MSASTMADPTSDSATAVTYVLCRMSDIPNRQAVGFHLMREDGAGGRHWPILVLRWGRQVLGYVNHCPHHGVNLDWERGHFLDHSGTRLICGKHGSLFEFATGRCIEGPCAGQALTPVPLALIDGDICVVGVRLLEDEEGM